MARRLLFPEIDVRVELYLAASALALASVSAPAAAQMTMPGMTMPMPAKPAAKKKAPAKKKAAAHPMPMDHSQMGNMPMPAQPAPTGEMNMPMAGQGGHEMAMTGALGAGYPMERESSGTAWQPDTSEHMGLHVMSGDWMLMAHGVLNLVYDHQSGPRGDDKAFASGMLMGMARRPLGNGTLQFKAMLSPDPLMGPSGYPLLLASGETANGRDRLIDRQHPHDFFMELSASVSQDIGRKSSVVPLRRPSRRAGVRAAGVHAPRSHHGFARGADQPPLARFDAHQLRRGYGRCRARPGQARGQPLQRARARPAPVEHRGGAARFHVGSRFVEPDRGHSRCRAAGGISSIPSSSSPE